MKKFAVLSLISFLILAFGATVYGQEKAPALQFKASGWMDVQSIYNRNTPNPPGTTTNDVVYSPPNAAFLPGGAAFDKKAAYMETRGRLKFDAIMGKEMMGTIQFEIDSTRWGELTPKAAGNRATYDATKPADAAQRNYTGAWGADRASLEVKNWYMTFGVPVIPIPITVQGGLIPIAQRSHVFLYVDGMGIAAAAKIDPATIKFVWAKPFEGSDWESDDADLYILDANAKIQTITVGAFGSYWHSKDYPLAGELTGGTRGDTFANMLWVGLYADGKVGPLNMNFDFIYDDGKLEDHRAIAARAGDVDFSGWLARVKLLFPWEKFTFGFAGAYGTGADAKKTGAKPAPGTATDVDAYVLPPSDGAAGDGIILYGCGLNRNTTGYLPAPSSRFTRSNIAGTWYAKAIAGFQVTPSYKATMELFYIGDTTDNGNTIGNAVTSTGALRDDSDIGIEIDILNEIKIYKNLKWGIGFGYLFAGDAMDYQIGTTNTNDSPKDPWALVTSLTYSF